MNNFIINFQKYDQNKIYIEICNDVRVANLVKNCIQHHFS